MRIEDAVKRLNHEDPAVRDQATATVLAARQGAVAFLVNELPVPGAPVARLALLLAALKAREALPAFASLVQRGMLDGDARATVARAFAELVAQKDAGDGEIARAVLALSKDVHPATRQLIVRALSSLGDTTATARLRELSGDLDEGVRKAAQGALAVLKPAPLASAPTGHEDGGIHLDLEAAVRAHQERAPPPPQPKAPAGPHAALHARLCDSRRAVRDAAVDEAVAQGKVALPGLLAALRLPQSGARLGAAMALARLQAPDAASALLDAALAAAHAPPGDDGEVAVAAVALKGLANCLTGAEEGIAQPLLPLVKHADPFVRAGALLCLGRLSDRVGARAAVIALTDAHDHVKEAAAVALSEGVREEDAELVVPLLAVLGGMPSPSSATREAILLALSRIHVTDAPTLVRVRHRARTQVLGATASVRRTALALLERCYGTDDPPPVGVIDDVLSRLKDDHPEVRLLAASFLAQHLEPGVTDGVERLEDALDRGEQPVSLLLLEALRRHDTDKARQALEAVAGDVDETLAARARALLEGFAPRTEEWTVGSATSAPNASSSSSASRRRRPAPSGEVVEAKDAPTPGGENKPKP
ncbi:MAG: hypothetical protein HYS27_07390 [Deltaproteobacteria bacterium]|nr:hypothetical protein [Deltaproteobacteria bacterium]